MHIEAAYRAPLQACGLARAADVLGRVAGRVVAWSRTTETMFIAGVGGGPGFYLKRYLYPRWKNRLRGMLRGTFFGQHRGLAEYRTLQAMRGGGVPTVRPVAYGARRIGHFVSACFLITEQVPDALNLTSFAQGVQTRGEPRAAGLLLEALAGAVAHMHEAGFEHGQLFWRNILVRPSGIAPEFFFLDPQPQPVRRMARGDRWWRRELASLLVSATPFTTRSQRLRFLLRYAGARRLSGPLKQIARDVADVSSAWRKHEAQRIKMNGLFERWLVQLDEELERDGQAAARRAPPCGSAA